MKRSLSKRALATKIEELQHENARLQALCQRQAEIYDKETTQLAEIIRIQRAFLLMDHNIEIHEEVEDDRDYVQPLADNARD